MSTGRMMSMCEHAKIYGKCDVCLRAEIEALQAERLELRRSLFTLIELCNLDSVNLVDDDRVRNAKELIRCSVQGCGLGGACDGKGLAQYPCPLRAP